MQSMTHNYPYPLTQSDAEIIFNDSAIDPDVAAERGTRSIHDPADLLSYGFADYQCRPGILFLEWTVDGEQIGGSLRPDEPRSRPDGKALKYERPAGLTTRLDVHPRVFQVLGDPSVPLAITEGVRKADCLISHGIMAISVPGVWGWLSRNEHGATTLSTDFRCIALKGRLVRLYFDSDLFVKPGVRQALLELADVLRKRGAHVEFAFWGTGLPDEPKGIDDVYAAGREANVSFSDSLPAVGIPGHHNGLCPVEQFPIDRFPGRAHRYAVQAADANALPAGMVALPMIAAAGGILGESVVIEEKPGKLHYPSVWGVVVAVPGVGKTAGQDAALLPVYELQQRAMERYTSDLEAYERSLAEWSRDKKGPRPEEPRIEHLYVTDVTTEALYPILAREPGLIVALDEISSFTARHDQYRANGKGSDRQNYLSAWSSSPSKIDRKNAATIMVNRPVIGMMGGCQPGVLHKVHDGQQDGLSDRMLFYWPDAAPSPYSDATVSTEAVEGYRELFQELYRIRTSSRDGALVVHLNSSSIRMFRDWFNDNQNLIACSPAQYQGMLAKLPQQVMRIALILHVLTHPRHPNESQVSEQTMAGAIAIVECLASHARRVIAYLGRNTEDQPATFSMRVLRRIEDAGDWVSLTDLHRKFGNRTKSQEMRAAVDELEQTQRIERRRITLNGREIDHWRPRSDHSANDELMNSDEPAIKEVSTTPDELMNLDEVTVSMGPVERIGIPPGCIGPQICAIKGVCGRASCQVDASDQEVA